MTSRRELETGLKQYGETSVDPRQLKGVLHEDSIVGLSPKFRDELRRDIFEVNRAWSVSGEAMKACILYLDDIKRNYPKQYESIFEHELEFSKSIAYDLVKAAAWVRQHDIPTRFLANISARSLRTVATEKTDKIKAAMTDLIISKEGGGVAESDLVKLKKEMTSNISRANKEVKEVKEKAKNELAANASAETVREWFKKELEGLNDKMNAKENQVKDIKSKNETLKEDNKDLREQIASLKKQVPTSEASKKLIEYVKADPQAVKATLSVFEASKEKKEQVTAKAKEAAAAVAS